MDAQNEADSWWVATKAHISIRARERKIINELIFVALVSIDSQAISVFLKDSVPVDKNLFISDFKTFQLSLENLLKDNISHVSKWK